MGAVTPGADKKADAAQETAEHFAALAGRYSPPSHLLVQFGAVGALWALAAAGHRIAAAMETAASKETKP